MNDTSPQMQQRVHTEMMKRKPEERALMGLSMFEDARAIVASSFPSGLSDKERLHRLFLRFYSRDFSPDAQRNIRQRIFRSEESNR